MSEKQKRPAAAETIQRWWRSLPKSYPLESLWRGFRLKPQYGSKIVRMILKLAGKNPEIRCFRWGTHSVFPVQSVLVMWRDILIVMPPETDLGVDCPETSRTWFPVGVKSILDPKGEYYFSNRERWLAGAGLSDFQGFEHRTISTLHGSGALLLWIAEMVLKEGGTNPMDYSVLGSLRGYEFQPRTPADLTVLIRLLQAKGLEDRTRYRFFDPRVGRMSYVSRERALEIIDLLKQGGTERRILDLRKSDFDRFENGRSHLDMLREYARSAIKKYAHLLTPELCVEFFKVLESRGKGHTFTVPKASPEGVRSYMLELGFPALFESNGFWDCNVWTERVMTVFGPEAVKEFLFSEDGPRGRYPILLGTLVEHVGFPAGFLAGAVDTWIGRHKCLLMKLIANASGEPEGFRGLVVRLMNKGDPLVLNAVWNRYPDLMKQMVTTNRRLEALARYGMCSTPGCHESVGGRKDNRKALDGIALAIDRGEAVTAPTGIYCRHCAPKPSVPLLWSAMFQTTVPRSWHGVYCNGPCCASWGIQQVDRVKVVGAPEDFPGRLFSFVFEAERPPTEEGYHSTSHVQGNAFVAVLKPDGSAEFPEKNAFSSVLRDCDWYVPKVRIYEIPRNGRVHCVGMEMISSLPFTETTFTGLEDNWEQFSDFISGVLEGIDPDNIEEFFDLGVDPKNPEAVLKEAYPSLVSLADELRKTSPCTPIPREKEAALSKMIYNSLHFPGKNEIPGLQETFTDLKVWLMGRVKASSMCDLYSKNPERFDVMVSRMLSHPVDGPWVRQLAIDSSVRHESAGRYVGGVHIPEHLIPVGLEEHASRVAFAYALRLWGRKHRFGSATVPSGNSVTEL